MTPCTYGLALYYSVGEMYSHKRAPQVSGALMCCMRRAGVELRILHPISNPNGVSFVLRRCGTRALT